MVVLHWYELFENQPVIQSSQHEQFEEEANMAVTVQNEQYLHLILLEYAGFKLQNENSTRFKGYVKTFPTYMNRPVS